MSGAGFILAINLAVAGLLAAAFILVAAYDARMAAPRWFALAHVLGAGYFLVEFAVYAVGGGVPLAVFSFSVFLAALAAFDVGLARRYGVVVPWRLIAISFAASVVLCLAIQWLPRTSFWRMLAYQSPYFLMQAIGVGIIAAAQRKSRLDIILQGLLAASAIHYLAKASLFRLFGGTGATPRDYLDTDYALISQTVATVLALSVALLTLLILLREILIEVTQRSEMDALSRLLNRGGFERQASAAVERCRYNGLPVSLILADLDNFKSVNDTYGHAVGDKVIQNFAALLSSSGGSHVAARLGGEEFAILLPGSNLVAARLFAEGLRNAFLGEVVEQVSPNVRFTASFGVAELYGSEDLDGLTGRADAALYAAKRAGRDCVRVGRPFMTDRGEAERSGRKA